MSLQLSRTNTQIRLCTTLCALLLISTASAENACSSKELQGSWELQSAIYRDQSGKVVAEIKDQQTKSRKLIAGRHFSFITWRLTASSRSPPPAVSAPTPTATTNRSTPPRCHGCRAKPIISSAKSAATTGCTRGWKTAFRLKSTGHASAVERNDTTKAQRILNPLCLLHERLLQNCAIDCQD